MLLQNVYIEYQNVTCIYAAKWEISGSSALCETKHNINATFAQQSMEWDMKGTRGGMLLKSITLPEDKSESEKQDRTHYTNPQLFSVHFLHSSFSFVGAMCVHFSISIQLTHNEEKENVICFYLVVTLLFLWRCAFFDDVWQKHIKASKKERKLVSLTLAAQRCVEMNPVHIRAPAQAYTQITYFR